MALFKKKTREAEYDDEEYEDEASDISRGKGSYQKRLIRNKDFKDLKGENSKKRKEPAKPWGKMERLWVLLLIILTTGISGYLALSARDFKLPGFPRLKLPEITMPKIFQPETIVIEGNKEDNQKAEKAISQFEEKTKNLSGVYALYVIRLDNGDSYGINEDETFQAASLIKLPVMAGMYMEEEEGSLSLSSKYKLKAGDKIAGSGSLSGKPVGYEITYGNLLKLMGKESDNTAFNVSKKYLGEEKISEVMNKNGMVNTSIAKNETTAKDIGNYFKELWDGNIVAEENKGRLLDSLTDTIYEDHLAAGIPKGIRVAHKYGREVHVVNDAGIVYSDYPYIAVILSKGVIEKEADGVFPELSKM